MTSRIPWARLALLLICLAAFALRVRGLNWPAFHPDEPVVGRWLEQAVRGATPKERLYARGFFAAARPAVWIGQKWELASIRVAFWRGRIDHVPLEAYDPVMAARWVNVWLGTLVCIPVYLLVRRLTRSSAAGLLGAALAGLAQYPVEHSHYGETDMAMLLALALALWLMAAAADGRRRGLFVLAALAGGAAAATKFTLWLLLPPIMALGLTLKPAGSERHPLRSAAGWALAGLAAFLAGFVLMMPEVLDGRWFLDALAYERARVFGEGSLNLGPFGADPGMRRSLHTWDLLRHARTLGAGWLLLAALGLPDLARRERRRFWTLTLLFPFLFLYYWIYRAPWVRSQEFMVFLPGLALLAGLGAAAGWRSGRLAMRLAVLVLAAAALGGSAVNGCRAASLFAWTDTRVLARRWLQNRLTAGRGVAAESYVESAWPGVAREPPIAADKVERLGLPALSGQGAEYLLRAASITGRGLRHPLTQALYAEPQARFDEFILGSERLAAWGPLPPVRTTFGSPVVELYGLRRFARETKLNLPLSQPLWVDNWENRSLGRQTFFPLGRHLGAALGVLIDREPRTVAVGGPDLPPGPVYLVLHTAERSATVRVDGFGRTRRVALAPWSAAILPLERAAHRPRASAFEEITLRADPVKDVLFLPCFARLAFTASEAVRACLDLEMEEAAWAAFSETELVRACHPTLVYLLAVRAGRWALAADLEPRVGPAAEALAAAAAADPAGVRINGASGYYYNDLARVRLSAAPRSVAGWRDPESGRTTFREMMTTERLALTRDGLSGACETILELPVRTPAGRYRFAVEAMQAADDPGVGATFDVYSGEPERLLARYRPERPDAWAACMFEFQVGRESQPRFVVRADRPGALFLRAMEIHWTLADRLAAAGEELTMARAEHAIHDGRLDCALELLARLPPGEDRWNETAVRQAEFEARARLGDPAAAARAARRLLERAPAHYAALQCLAASNAGAARAAAALAATIERPVEFGGCLSLVAFRREPGGALQAVWEAAGGDVPPLAISLWLRRRGEWRRKQVQPLGGRALARGERVRLRLEPGKAFDGCPPEALALGVETDVEWHPGLLPSAGRTEAVIPLSELMTKPADPAGEP